MPISFSCSKSSIWFSESAIWKKIEFFFSFGHRLNIKHEVIRHWNNHFHFYFFFLIFLFLSAMLGHSFGNITKGQSREFPVYLNAINFVWSINIVNDFISTKWILTFMESHIDLFSLTHYWRVHFISMGRVHSIHPSSIVNYNFISIELFIIPRVVYVSLRVAESCCLCPCIYFEEKIERIVKSIVQKLN